MKIFLILLLSFSIYAQFKENDILIKTINTDDYIITENKKQYSNDKKLLCEVTYLEFKSNFENIDKEINELVNNSECPSLKEEENIIMDISSHYQFHYDLILNSFKNYVSLLVIYYEYTGGAHGNTTSKSFNYKIENRKALKINSLFDFYKDDKITSIDSFIKEIYKKNESCVNKEAKKLLKKEEAYKIWNIKNDNILILYFDPYIIAPYYCGRIEVFITK